MLVKRPATIKQSDYQTALILRTELERTDGQLQAFGKWLVVDITVDTVEQFQRVRMAKGLTAANRDLAVLRAMFGWAVGRDHIERTPFKKGTEVVVRLSKETSRRRRLQGGEGELLSLQWWQVRSEPKAELFLPAVKTKTKTDRTVPVSTRLKVLLEMRRDEAIVDMRKNDEDAKELPSDWYVFGNELGEQTKSFKRAWQRAVLVAHGHKPEYRKAPRGKAGKLIPTGTLTSGCLATLQTIGLHFHDLRREAGSRWLDNAVPLHRIQKWLGHANISQTSTYLMADSHDDDDAMKRFEERQAELQRIATEAKTGGYEGAQSATIEDSGEQETLMKPH